MARPASTQLTEVEVQILDSLWQLGPSTVRQVHRHLEQIKETQYSTTVKMLLVMLEKGLVRRDEVERPIVYRAAMTRERAQKRMLGDLITRLYDGSAKTLMMHAITSKKTSPDELAEIRQLLDELEESQS
jgi:BlaI family penicillinase repressor